MHDALKTLTEGVLKADKRQLARAITLVESDLHDHKEMAALLLKNLAPHSNRAIRVGISGPPGVGKSTLIEALGMKLIEEGHRVAVLAIDPTSPISRGSILGDKTRMPNLSRNSQAFVRPSPSRGLLGGVAPGSKEVMQVLEAANFDVILVETVGVGQSEVAVAHIVDVFVLLISPASGDALQGAKKGILEMAHVVAVTKNDGDLKARAQKTRHEYLHALSTGRSLKSTAWQVPVLLVSSTFGEGIAELWHAVLKCREHQRAKLSSQTPI